MIVRKSALFALAVLVFMLGCIPQNVITAASATKHQTIYTAQAHFMKINKFSKEHLAQSFRYDINNDGKEEIIIAGWNHLMGVDAVSAIGVYTAQGKLMKNQRLNSFDDFDYWLIGVRKVHNTTYQNILAAEYVGGATGGSLAEVFVWKNNKLTSILTTEKSETGIIFKDLNGDQNHEIIGETPYGGKDFEGSYHQAPLHKFVYQWNKNSKVYNYHLYLNNQ